MKWDQPPPHDDRQENQNNNNNKKRGRKHENSREILSPFVLFFLRLSAVVGSGSILIFGAPTANASWPQNPQLSLTINAKKENVNYDNGRHREAFTSRKKIYLTPSEKEKDQLGNIHVGWKKVH